MAQNNKTDNPQVVPENTQGEAQGAPETETGAGQVPDQSGATASQEGGAQQTETAAAMQTVFVKADNGLNLRGGPGLGFQSWTVLPDGTALVIHPLPGGAEVPGWVLVETPDGLFGWVDRRFLSED